MRTVERLEELLASTGGQVGSLIAQRDDALAQLAVLHSSTFNLAKRMLAAEHVAGEVVPLRRRVDLLQDLVDTYAEHHEPCPLWVNNPTGKCNCGLEKKLAKATSLSEVKEP